MCPTKCHLFPKFGKDWIKTVGEKLIYVILNMWSLWPWPLTLTLKFFLEEKGLINVSLVVENDSYSVSNDRVITKRHPETRSWQTNKHTKPQTYLQTNRRININGFRHLTNIQTNIPININGFRHLIKYRLIFNFFQNQTSEYLSVG